MPQQVKCGGLLLQTDRQSQDIGQQGRPVRVSLLALQLPRPSSRPAICMAGLIALGAYAAWLMPLTPIERPQLIIAAIFVAALVSSVAGFAFSAICGAMLFHLIDDPVRAVQIMMVCSVGGQALMVWALRRDIVWRSLSIFLVGAAAGLPLGVFILLHSTPGYYAQAVGVLLVSYALFMVFRRPMIIRRQNLALDAVAGFLGGITGGAAAFPGAFVTIWCGFKGWTKERQRGLYQPFILIVQVAAILVMAVSDGGPGRPHAFDFAGIAYLPAMFLGATFGMAFFKRLNDRQFTLIVNLLLVVSGLSFLV
jgi:uncharacterized membrane protein YfcA